jgi:hypothetical protein
MQFLNSIFQTGKLFVFTLAGWLLSVNLLFAKSGDSGESKEGGSWVFSYFLVLLGIILGMIVVCRSSSRRDRVRPESYAEKGGSHASEKK